jgi:hypothetical protein
MVTNNCSILRTAICRAISLHYTHLPKKSRVMLLRSERLAFSTQVRVFKPGRSPIVFQDKKNPQHTFLQRRSKAALSHVADLRNVKDPCDVPWKSTSSAKTTGQIHLSLLESLASCGRIGTWRRKLECSKLGRGGFRVGQ